MQRWVKKKYGHLPRHGDMDKENGKKREQRRRSPRVSDVFVRETYNVSFHVLINSRVITGKLIPQSLSSFNEANYERHKCKHLIVVYTSATRVQNPAVRREKRAVLIRLCRDVSFPYLRKRWDNFRCYTRWSVDRELDKFEYRCIAVLHPHSNTFRSLNNSRKFVEKSRSAYLVECLRNFVKIRKLRKRRSCDSRRSKRQERRWTP